MLSMLGGEARTVGELLAGAREPMLARPVLMHLLWTGGVIVDVTEPIADASRVWRPAGRVV